MVCPRLSHPTCIRTITGIRVSMASFTKVSQRGTPRLRPETVRVHHDGPGVPPQWQRLVHDLCRRQCPLSQPVQCHDSPHNVDDCPNVNWTNSIIPLFASKRPSDKLLAPTRCGNGHELTPDNLGLAERGTRWCCRQCGMERAAAWRRRHSPAA